MSDPQSMSGALLDLASRLDAMVVSDEQIERYEAERERDRRRERLTASGIDEHLPPEIVDAVVADELDRTHAVDLVRRWVAYQAGPRTQGSKPVFGLLGNMGRGKTVAAAWLIAAEGGRYMLAEDFCRLQSARFGDERAEYLRLLRLRTLVVDEVGTEESAERGQAMLHDIADRRLARRTLLLGNVTKSELRERLDARTTDRLRSCGVFHELAGESMRSGGGL